MFRLRVVWVVRNEFEMEDDMILAHKIRLVPTREQEEYFRRACGTVRFTYNWALVAWKEAYESGKKPSGRSLKKDFNAIRKSQFPWTYEVHRDCTAGAFDHIQSAFQNFFRTVKAGGKSGYPAFKKKGHSKDSFDIANDKLQLQERQVRIPVLGWVKMRETLRFEGKILGAVVSRSADQWHIAIQVDVGELNRERTGNSVVGVDLGIKASATLSTGEVVQGPKALRSHLKKLRRLSRRHSRKQKRSANRRKSALKLGRIHLRITNIRKDRLDKLSTRLVSENQAVGIEDLHVKGMVRNRSLARAISDEGWSEFRRQLEYKAPMFGTEIVVHDRWLPSSKACSGCGHVKEKLLLGERTYSCAQCSLVIDRDHNAALNLKPEELPVGYGNVKPVEMAALVSCKADETAVLEAGTGT